MIKWLLMSYLGAVTLNLVLAAGTRGNYFTDRDPATFLQSSVKPFYGCANATYPPNPSTAVGTYTVDLALQPSERWTQLVEDKKQHLLALVDHVFNLTEILMGERNFKFLLAHLDSLTSTLPSPYREEMAGIASASGLTVEEVTLYNVFYELFTFCTSMLVMDNTGTVHHARNLDFGLFLGWDNSSHHWTVAELLKPLVVQLDWVKGGKTVYSSVNYIGYVGVVTGVKKGAFSYSMNERFSWNGGYVGLLEWILFKDYGQKWVSFLSRDVMEFAETYEQAQQKLTTERLLAPAYFILGGAAKGQGSIITRYRDGYDLLTLGSRASPADWFLVQTNYDHWRSPPFYDDRRTPAVSCLLRHGENETGLNRNDQSDYVANSRFGNRNKVGHTIVNRKKTIGNRNKFDDAIGNRKKTIVNHNKVDDTIGNRNVHDDDWENSIFSDGGILENVPVNGFRSDRNNKEVVDQEKKGMYRQFNDIVHDLKYKSRERRDIFEQVDNIFDKKEIHSNHHKAEKSLASAYSNDSFNDNVQSFDNNNNSISIKITNSVINIVGNKPSHPANDDHNNSDDKNLHGFLMSLANSFTDNSQNNSQSFVNDNKNVSINIKNKVINILGNNVKLGNDKKSDSSSSVNDQKQHKFPALGQIINAYNRHSFDDNVQSFDNNNNNVTCVIDNSIINVIGNNDKQPNDDVVSRMMAAITELQEKQKTMETELAEMKALLASSGRHKMPGGSGIMNGPTNHGGAKSGISFHYDDPKSGTTVHDGGTKSGTSPDGWSSSRDGTSSGTSSKTMFATNANVAASKPDIERVRRPTGPPADTAEAYALMHDVLSTRPVLNKLTTYTSLMTARVGVMHTWLKDCPDPCWPW